MPRPRRKTDTRRTKAVFFLACEDSKSAPAYFKALFRLYSGIVTPQFATNNANQTSPRQVVERAVKCRNDCEKLDPKDQTWAIFDAEPQAGPDYKKQIKLAKDLATSNKIDVSVSNPCIEHWFHLHLREIDGAHDSADKAVRAFSKSWKTHCKSDYSKGKSDLGKILSTESVANATQWAKSQHTQKDCASPECCPPCVTDLYLLIEELNKLQ